MITVRKALPGEGAKVAERIRISLSRSIEGLTIWHCRHVDRWVEMRIAAPGGSAFYVASDESTGLVGAAEFRTIDGTVFLNQIGVIASRQGERIGGRLLAAGLHGLCRSGASASLALDVETGNKRAAAWYRRLGLAPVAQTYWMVTDLRPDGVAPAPVQGWMQAEHELARFGFSQFQVGGADGNYAAGCLGDGLFRLTSAKAWGDPAVHAALRRIDASRRVLLISDSPVEGVQPVRKTERLTGPIAPILAALPAP